MIKLNIKFRITSKQFEGICKNTNTSLIGECGLGDYFVGEFEYVMFSLMNAKEVVPIQIENLTYKFNYIPVIFIKDSYDNKQLLDLVDMKMKAFCSINYHNVIVLSVWIEKNEITTILAHFNNLAPQVITTWSIIGDDISYSHSTEKELNKETQLRTIQAFGEGTVRTLSSLCVGVIGASGTGSPIIEMFFRTGVGELVIVDPDKVEKKNLNRILNTSISDAINGRAKVEVLKEAISTYGFSTKVEALTENLFSIQAVKALSRCDVIFGCTDTADSRALLNSISQFYCIPYIDVGVQLAADGNGNIKSICAATNYVAPDGITLVKRETITVDEIYAAALKRKSPKQYQQELEDKYIKGINVESPAVLCVNMAASSFAFLDFLSRIHKIRSDQSKEYNRTYIDYTNMRIIPESFENTSYLSLKNLGLGDVKPLLYNVDLS